MRHDGKTLLILGATAYSINVIRTAKAMGARTIVVDPVKNAKAKKFADAYYDVDTTNIDALYQIALEEKVDGVFTGYSDVNLFSCRSLCDKLNLPFYGTLEQLQKTTDKLRFKEMCRKYGVGTVPQYTEDQLETVPYPIIIKPADSWGSKGISVCYSYEETPAAVEKAIKYSKTSQIIVEKYMGACDVVNFDYVMQDGKILLSAVGDRYVNTEQKGLSPLTAAGVYPSKYLKEYLELQDANVKKMFYEEGMHNGTTFIQAFFDGEQFYVFEMGYRTGGGQGSIPLKVICDLDYVEFLINFAFTGKMSDKDLSQYANPAYDKRSCALVVILKSGTIGKIEGLDAIKELPQNINITQFYEEGEEVPPTVIGNLGQSLCRMHFVADSWEELKQAVQFANRTLKVTSTEGENMIVAGGFNGEALC